jgi:hypothetical protein
VFLTANGGKATCEISVYGGHVISWKVKEKPQNSFLTQP